mmetsp:Transcript_18280/g.37038  ORF Transcript_18280/g.37038 Transcript_18280/m.37038 type:complete len:221 (-) Transcript_18280:4659-5321(-)
MHARDVHHPQSDVELDAQQMDASNNLHEAIRATSARVDRLHCRGIVAPSQAPATPQRLPHLGEHLQHHETLQDIDMETHLVPVPNTNPVLLVELVAPAPLRRVGGPLDDVTGDTISPPAVPQPQLVQARRPRMPGAGTSPHGQRLAIPTQLLHCLFEMPQRNAEAFSISTAGEQVLHGDQWLAYVSNVRLAQDYRHRRPGQLPYQRGQLLIGHRLSLVHS